MQLKRTQYNGILRVLALLAAAILWYLSVRFSEQGFGFNMPGYTWAGTALALCVTVIELIWSKEGMKGNLTITAGGLLAYLYGIYSNHQGIMFIKQTIGASVGSDPWNFSLVVSLFLEVLPEPLFVWALVGSSMDTGGDFVSNLIQMFGIRKPSFGAKRPAYAVTQQGDPNRQSGKPQDAQQRQQQVEEQRRRQQQVAELQRRQQQASGTQAGHRQEPSYHPSSMQKPR